MKFATSSTSSFSTLVAIAIYLSRGAAASSLRGVEPARSSSSGSERRHLLQGLPCETSTDCPEVNCFAPPCELAACESGYCLLVESTEDWPSLPSVSESGGFLPPPPPESIAIDDGNVTTTTFQSSNTGVSCNTTDDCPVINCFAPPCDNSTCDSGYCHIWSSGALVDDGDWPELEPEQDLPETSGPMFATANSSSNSEGEKCGPVTCSAGDSCCNFSCGYCTPPGGVCTKEFCQQEIKTEEFDGFEGADGEDEEGDGGGWMEVTEGTCACNKEDCTICRNVFGTWCLQVGCHE